MNGFITLDKKILNWEWYKSMNEYKLFTHLLITANFKQGTFRGMQVRRGQLITSLNHLASDSGMSLSAVRTAIKNLSRTGEISVKSTQLYSVITICKYDTYQDKNSGVNTPINTRINKRINTPTNTPINNNRNNTKKRNSASNPLNGLPAHIDTEQFYNQVQFLSRSADTDHAIADKIRAKFNELNWTIKGKEINNTTMPEAILITLKDIAK